MTGNSLQSVCVCLQWFADPNGFNLKKKLSDSSNGAKMIEFDESDSDDWRNYLHSFCLSKRELIDEKLNSFRNEEMKTNEIQM